jgi:hypothetical protein
MATLDKVFNEKNKMIAVEISFPSKDDGYNFKMHMSIKEAKALSKLIEKACVSNKKITRSSKSGKFVKKSYAKKNPDTTVEETI